MESPEKTENAGTPAQTDPDTTPAWIKKIDAYRDGLDEYYSKQTSDYSKIFTTLNGIYVALLVFFGLSGEKTLHQFPFLYQMCFLLPILFWLIGMYHFLNVQSPQLALCRPGDYFCYKRAMENSTVHKAHHYRKGIFFSSIGILLMLVPIATGSFFVSTMDPFPPNSQVELVIENTNFPVMQESYITFYNNTNRTTPLILISKTNDSYRIKNSNGDILNIPVSWVKMAIIKNS
jgi:hypothetical protein